MRDSDPARLKLDIIGDVHGQLGALRRLGTELGYVVDGNWSHPQGRRPVFIGDLIDRGPHSLEVSELVRTLCADGFALCLLGNHELNLIEWRHGRTDPKNSNQGTIQDIEARRERWDPILDFFESLPLALEFDDLRVTHAAWHLGCVAQLHETLTVESSEHPVHDQWRPHVALHAAFERGTLRPGIPREPFPGQWEKSLEIFVKGYESKADEPFLDNDGTLRDQVRTEWWRPEYTEVATDKRIVFGHYWNMPPIPGKHGAFVPPFPSGHPELRAWFEDHHQDVASSGRTKVPEQVETVCIDFNGVTRAGERACIGAYRYPEAEVVWST